MTKRSQTAWARGVRQALLAGAGCVAIFALDVAGATPALAQKAPAVFAPLPDAPKINEARARLRRQCPARAHSAAIRAWPTVSAAGLRGTISSAQGAGEPSAAATVSPA